MKREDSELWVQKVFVGKLS